MKLIKIKFYAEALCFLAGLAALISIVGVVIAAVSNAEMKPAPAFLFYVSLPLCLLCFLSAVVMVACNQEIQKKCTTNLKDKQCSGW